MPNLYSNTPTPNVDAALDGRKQNKRKNIFFIDF